MPYQYAGAVKYPKNEMPQDNLSWITGFIRGSSTDGFIDDNSLFQEVNENA